jgi:soluble lytic murein transglycosylase-like protein
MAFKKQASTLSTTQPEVAYTAPVRATEGCEQYRDIVSQYDWDVNTMLAIMRAESSCNPASINYTDGHGSCVGSYSLLQVGCLHFRDGEDKLDPETNIAVAYRVWKSGGYTPWTCFTNNSYLQYL